MKIYKNGKEWIVTISFGEAMNIIAELEGDGNEYSIKEV